MPATCGNVFSSLEVPCVFGCLRNTVVGLRLCSCILTTFLSWASCSGLCLSLRGPFNADALHLRQIVFSSGLTLMEGIGKQSERHLYIQFFDHLGIDDETQLSFLATQLRTLFEAALKLDKYGASLHCAVS